MSTRDEIVEACVREIREHDEASFRVAVVAKNAGCATSVLYHYFGSRDGLIDAALIAIVSDETRSLLEFVELTTDAVESADDAIEFMVDYAAYAHSSARRANRALRARLLGASQTRPAVRKAFCEFGDLVAITNEAMILKLRDKGLIRHDLDIAAVTLCMRALDYGWALDDINDVPRVEFGAWLYLMRAMAETFAAQPSYLPRASAD
jgi:AcrR family transcriptional regulator